MPEHFGTAAAPQLPDLCRAETSIKIHRQWDRSFICSAGCWQPHKEGEKGDLGHMVPEAGCAPCCKPPGLIQLVLST